MDNLFSYVKQQLCCERNIIANLYDVLALMNSEFARELMTKQQGDFIITYYYQRQARIKEFNRVADDLINEIYKYRQYNYLMQNQFDKIMQAITMSKTITKSHEEIKYDLTDIRDISTMFKFLELDWFKRNNMASSFSATNKTSLKSPNHEDQIEKNLTKQLQLFDERGVNNSTQINQQLLQNQICSKKQTLKEQSLEKDQKCLKLNSEINYPNENEILIQNNQFCVGEEPNEEEELFSKCKNLLNKNIKDDDINEMIDVNSQRAIEYFRQVKSQWSFKDLGHEYFQNSLENCTFHEILSQEQIQIIKNYEKSLLQSRKKVKKGIRKNGKKNSYQISNGSDNSIEQVDDQLSQSKQDSQINQQNQQGLEQQKNKNAQEKRIKKEKKLKLQLKRNKRKASKKQKQLEEGQINESKINSNCLENSQEVQNQCENQNQICEQKQIVIEVEEDQEPNSLNEEFSEKENQHLNNEMEKQNLNRLESNLQINQQDYHLDHELNYQKDTFNQQSEKKNNREDDISQIKQDLSNQRNEKILIAENYQQITDYTNTNSHQKAVTQKQVEDQLYQNNNKQICQIEIQELDVEKQNFILKIDSHNIDTRHNQQMNQNFEFNIQNLDTQSNLPYQLLRSSDFDKYSTNSPQNQNKLLQLISFNSDNKNTKYDQQENILMIKQQEGQIKQEIQEKQQQQQQQLQQQQQQQDEGINQEEVRDQKKQDQNIQVLQEECSQMDEEYHMENQQYMRLDQLYDSVKLDINFDLLPQCQEIQNHQQLNQYQTQNQNNDTHSNINFVKNQQDYNQEFNQNYDDDQNNYDEQNQKNENQSLNNQDQNQNEEDQNQNSCNQNINNGDQNEINEEEINKEQNEENREQNEHNIDSHEDLNEQDNPKIINNNNNQIYHNKGMEMDYNQQQGQQQCNNNNLIELIDLEDELSQQNQLDCDLNNNRIYKQNKENQRQNLGLDFSLLKEEKNVLLSLIYKDKSKKKYQQEMHKKEKNHHDDHQIHQNGNKNEIIHIEINECSNIAELSQSGKDSPVLNVQEFFGLNQKSKQENITEKEKDYNKALTKEKSPSKQTKEKSPSQQTKEKSPYKQTKEKSPNSIQKEKKKYCKAGRTFKDLTKDELEFLKKQDRKEASNLAKRFQMSYQTIRKVLIKLQDDSN